MTMSVSNHHHKTSHWQQVQVSILSLYKYLYFLIDEAKHLIKSYRNFTVKQWVSWVLYSLPVDLKLKVKLNVKATFSWLELDSTLSNSLLKLRNGFFLLFKSTWHSRMESLQVQVLWNCTLDLDCDKKCLVNHSIKLSVLDHWLFWLV